MARVKTATTTRVRKSIITAWLLWGALVGAGVMVAVYLSALAVAVMGSALTDGIDGLDQSFLGVLAVPGFAVEGALGGALLGALVGVVAGIRPAGSMEVHGAVFIRLLGSLIFAVATVGVVGGLFDAGQFLSGSWQVLVRWGWAVSLGLVVGFVCYRTSSKPAEAMTQS
jgi:hypothetical protein